MRCRERQLAWKFVRTDSRRTVRRAVCRAVRSAVRRAVRLDMVHVDGIAAVRAAGCSCERVLVGWRGGDCVHLTVGCN